MPEVVIRQGGPFIQISDDGESLTSTAICRLVEPPLLYTHLTFHHGEDAHDPVTGRYTPCTADRRRLFQYDDRGRFVCQRGFYPKLRKVLEENGYTIHFQDMNQYRDPSVYEPDFDRVFSKFKFRPLQDVCLAQIAMHEYGVIDAVPAFGKGVVIPMITQMYPRATFDIVTKNKDVVATLYNRLLAYTPHVGRVGGGKRKKARITLYTADSLHHSDFTADFVLVDEIHQLMTDDYAASLSRYWTSRIFGFTATKETRADNAHHRMEGICGPTIFYLDQPTAEHHGLVVPVIVQWLDIDMGWNPIAGYRSLSARKKQGIWGNYFRNQIIAAAAHSFYSEGYQILITVDTVEHALYLRQFLPHFELCYSEQGMDDKKREKFAAAGIWDSSIPPMTDERRTKLRRDFESGKLQAAIATSVWRTGVSFDALQVLMRAEGGSSETEAVQGPGRVCRIDPTSNKQVGILVDCNDMFDSKFQGYTNDRKRVYAARKWVQYTASGQLWEPRERKNRARL